MTEKTLFVMKNPMCSGLSTVMATILSLSKTGWTKTNLRSWGNLDGQDVWLARVLKSVSFHAVCEYIFYKIDYTVQTLFS